LLSEGLMRHASSQRAAFAIGWSIVAAFSSISILAHNMLDAGL
jgi:hypothetical protein